MRVVVNPSTRGGLRPVDLITDRAKRYRANQAITQKDKRCIYCGRQRRRMDVEHIDGDEGHNNPENLAWACRPCNTSKGAHQAKLGKGQRTRQYNPRRRPAASGIRSLAQFVKAIRTVKGEGVPQMDYQAAVDLLHATPPDERSRWAKEAAARAAQMRGSSAVPF